MPRTRTEYPITCFLVTSWYLIFFYNPNPKGISKSSQIAQNSRIVSLFTLKRVFLLFFSLFLLSLVSVHSLLHRATSRKWNTYLTAPTTSIFNNNRYFCYSKFTFLYFNYKFFNTNSNRISIQFSNFFKYYFLTLFLLFFSHCCVDGR